MRHLKTQAILYSIIAIIVMVNINCHMTPELPETVVLISIDTLRPDHLSCYDYSRNTSPNIDRLAQDGILYRNCFATASSTAPSVASILTSRYPSQHGVGEYFLTKLNDSETTIAELLSNKGYRCAAFIGNPVITRERNLGQGFDFYDDTLPQIEMNRYTSERIADPLTDAAIEWLESGSGRRFVWLHFQDPHGPYFPPEKWRERYTPGNSALEKKQLPLLKDHGGYGGIPAYQKLFKHQDFGYYSAMYDSEIQYMDNALGRFFNYLKEKKLYRKSLIILTADHGEAFGENNYYFSHGHLSTPDQTRVPLIAKLPDSIERNKKESYQPVSTLDIVPSILSILHLPSSGNFAGICLPELPAYSKENNRLFYSETPWHYAAISDTHYFTREKPNVQKEFVNPISGGTTHHMEPLFYDIGKDNFRKNINIEEHAVTIKKMDRALRRFYQAGRAIPEGDIPEEKKKTLKSLGYLQ